MQDGYHSSEGSVQERKLATPTESKIEMKFFFRSPFFSDCKYESNLILALA